MRIATWNVNSVRQRTEALLAYLREVQPDVLCLQELKCQEEAFPRMEVEAAGYNVAVHGQKSYNGVAILSKAPIEIVHRPARRRKRRAIALYRGGHSLRHDAWCGSAAFTCRTAIRIGTEKYTYKLAWMDRLIAHAKKLLAYEERLVLCGDYNVIPDARDVYDPAAWVNDALFAPPTREKFRELLALGFFDALRATTDAGKQYTFWDYQAGAWQREQRPAHRPSAAVAAGRRPPGSVAIDKDMRAKDKPSDHVPIRIDLRD